MKNQEIRTLDARPVTLEVVTPSEFVAMKQSARAKIKVVEIVAPRLGSKDFGGVLIRHDSPVYKVFK